MFSIFSLLAVSMAVGFLGIVRQPKDLPLYQGDSESYTLQVRDSAGNPVDLSTGFTAKMQIKDSKEDTTAALELTESSGLDLSVAGEITISLTPAQTATLTDGQVYDLAVTETATSDERTIAYGKLKITKQVTPTA